MKSGLSKVQEGASQKPQCTAWEALEPELRVPATGRTGAGAALQGVGGVIEAAQKDRQGVKAGHSRRGSSLGAWERPREGMQGVRELGGE